MDVQEEAAQQSQPFIPEMDEDGKYKMPSMEELLNALDSMDSLSAEEKDRLRADLLQNAQQKAEFIDKLGAEAQSTGFAPDLLILLVFLTIVALIFVFFGYKLYKSLIDRERRREEKRKQKQQKKKK